MTEQSFILRNPDIRERALSFISALPIYPVTMMVVIKPFEKTRTLGQNSRYWVGLQEILRLLNATVNQIASDTGHSPLEIKREAARGLPIEHGIILFAKKAEVAHEVLKDICNVPTTTKLGTKKFMAYEERMLAVMTEILGHVRAMM